MTDPNRMEKLSEALELIETASREEKNELFKGHLRELKAHEARFETPDNRFDSYSSHAYRAMYTQEIFFRRLTGYNASWVSDQFSMHCSDNVGRPNKYGEDTREVNCFFITQMVHRGASETQAMKLLMRMRGDEAMTSGHLRELQDTYRDYKKIEHLRDFDISLLDNSYKIAHLLDFSVSNLEGDEAASHRAIAALRSLFQELIDLMKSSHDAIASGDGSYPEIYGCLIDWIISEYEDPLDYFYNHESHRTVPSPKRKRALREYINTIPVFSDRKSN